MVKKMTNKPILIAICGKSCSGKTVLANTLTTTLGECVPTNRIVSTTTRPRRTGEIDGIDYWYVIPCEFEIMINFNRFLEYSKFRNWYYGTDKKDILPDKINIGIFNPDGLKSLLKYKSIYNIIPVYLDTPLRLRLDRSCRREKEWKWEYLRRAITDHFDFRKINKLLNKFDCKIEIIENVQRLIETPTMKSRYVIWRLIQEGIVRPGQKSINTSN